MLRPAKKRGWKNVPGCCTVEIERDVEGRWVDISDYRPLGLPSVEAEIERLLPGTEEAVCEIHFLASGYYDSGNGWDAPPDGSEERLLDSVSVYPVDMVTGHGYCRNGQDLSEEAADQMFSAYRQIIEGLDLDYND
jgi:hypothetical protein